MDSFAYRFVLVLHLAAVVVGFGGILLNVRYASDALKRYGEAALAVMHANFSATLVAEKAIYVVPLTGLGLVGLSDGQWSFGQEWVWLSLVGFVVLMGASHGLLIPSQRRLLREVRTAAEQGRRVDVNLVRRQQGRLALGSGAVDILLIALLVLMVWKPGA